MKSRDNLIIWDILNKRAYFSGADECINFDITIAAENLILNTGFFTESLLSQKIFNLAVEIFYNDFTFLDSEKKKKLRNKNCFEKSSSTFFTVLHLTPTTCF